MLSPKEIDRICTRFETEWASTQSLSSIADTVCAHGISSESSLILAEELTSIDMERRWMNWSSLLDRDNTLGIPTLFRRLRMIPTVADYRRCFQECRVIEFELFDEQLSIPVRQHEFYCRRAFGDLPSPFNGEDINYPVSKMGITIEFGKAQAATFDCWGDVRVGRQSAGEPEKYSMAETDPPKIICADGRDSWVSRHQLRLRVLSDSFAATENESAGRPFMICENESRSVLAARGHQLVRFPCSFILNDLTVSITRNPRP